MNKSIKILCVMFCFVLFSILILSCQERKLKYGRVGKDTRYVVGNGMVQISHVHDENILEMYYTDTLAYTLLDAVTSYKSKDNNLYVISDEGYGVINKETYKCMLLVFNPEEYFKAGYKKYSNGKVFTLSPNDSKKTTGKIAFYNYTKTNNSNIVFLDSFDSFSENDQRILLNLCKTNVFDAELMGKNIKITIAENTLVDADYLKKVQSNEIINDVCGFDLMDFDVLNLLIEYVKSNNLAIVSGVYELNENWIFESGKMVTHAGEFVDVFEFCEMN